MNCAIFLISYDASLARDNRFLKFVSDWEVCCLWLFPVCRLLLLCLHFPANQIHLGHMVSVDSAIQKSIWVCNSASCSLGSYRAVLFTAYPYSFLWCFLSIMGHSSISYLVLEASVSLENWKLVMCHKRCNMKIISEKTKLRHMRKSKANKFLVTLFYYFWAKSLPKQYQFLFAWWKSFKLWFSDSEYVYFHWNRLYFNKNRRILKPAEIVDLLKGVMVLVCCYLMGYIDTSVCYHIIKTQSTIKLYLFFNMLEIADRWVVVI